MEISPTLKLAIALDQKPRGVYALLLGSGISTSAGIPTGWQITLDLIVRISKVAGEEVVGDQAEQWYRTKFGEEPGYDTLLKKLSSTATERQRILREYIEPSIEEQEEGTKVPSAAHRSIATLVKSGHIRVIVTTNFDRLLEQALQDVGIVPDVVSSEDGIAGAIPLVHSNCTIIKVHGDYLDTRIKNTPDELDTYSNPLNLLLDRVFDEFGLIICGWSAEWDTALRSAILRCPNRRFATYWLSRGAPKGKAAELVARRAADQIEIKSADSFFVDLAEKADALNQSLRVHPISRAVAIATVERYLPNPEHRIRLHNLVTDEGNRVSNLFATDQKFSTEGEWDVARIQKRLTEYFHSGETYWSMLASIAYHSNGQHKVLLSQSVEWLQPDTVYGDAFQFKQYPSVLSMYTVGVSAVAASNFHNVAAVLLGPVFTDTFRNTRHLAIERTNISSGMYSLYEFLYRQAVRGSFASDMEDQRRFNADIAKSVRQVAAHVIRRDSEFILAYETLEFILALTYMDKVDPEWSPMGSYYWKYFTRYTGGQWEGSALAKFLADQVKMEAASPLVQAGLVGGSSERFKELLSAQIDFLRNRKSH